MRCFDLDQRIESVQFKTWQVLKEGTWKLRHGGSVALEKTPKPTHHPAAGGTTHFLRCFQIFVFTHSRC
jgi:hypothetical protein